MKTDINPEVIKPLTDAILALNEHIIDLEDRSFASESIRAAQSDRKKLVEILAEIYKQ